MSPKGDTGQDLSAAAEEALNLIQNLSDEQRKQVLQGMVTEFRIEQSFTGPLPLPDHFREYEKVHSGAAHRIIKIAENEQDTRREGQRGIIANDRWRINSATLVSISITIPIGIATCIAAWKGYYLIATPLGLLFAISTLMQKFYKSSN